MTNFANIAKETATKTLTENGAVAYNTLGNSLLNLFALAGSLRPRTEMEIEDKFYSAFNENHLLATKLMFYAGNIRGGLGERRTFRIMLRSLAENHPHIVKKNMGCIPMFNRWDSLFELVNTPVESDMWRFVKDQLASDIQGMQDGRPISLLGKWMPSINTSSAKTRKLAHRAMKYLGIQREVKYRKMLTALRDYLNVVEHQMSNQQWAEINYAHVPSYAMMHYNRAFGRHDYERFSEYIASLNKGETKVNASVLFPYDLTKNFLGRNAASNLLAEQQWKALPNYISGENNVLIMADVSGSMEGRPMETSVGLAIYFAEHNKGAYENLYMTFTDKPHFIRIDPNASLREKCRQVEKTDIGYNTNLEAAFQYVLDMAVYSHVNPDEMPKAIIVVSDGEIDRFMEEENPYSYRRGVNWDFIVEMKNRFATRGYQLPKMILWNVESRADRFLSKSEDVLFVSGQSTSTFKTLLGALDMTSSEMMLATLNDPMYDCVVV